MISLVYVVANRASAEKIVDDRIYHTFEDAEAALNALSEDIRPSFSVYSALIEIGLKMFSETE